MFSDLYDLHQSGVALDTKLIVDDGELAIHWPLLQLWGPNWWSGLGQAGADNVVLLPGVSMNEAQEFVDVLYGRFQASNKHFTVTEDTGVTDEDMYNNNISDEGDINWSLMRFLTSYLVIFVERCLTTKLVWQFMSTIPTDSDHRFVRSVGKHSRTTSHC